MKICILTPAFPPESWGGLARTAERVARHACALGADVHVAAFSVVDEPLVLLDENRRTTRRDGITLHRLRLGRFAYPEEYRGWGDSPHTRAIKTLYQSLEILHAEERYDLLHAFFLYPAGYVAGLLAGRHGVRSLVTLVGNDVKRHFFQPEAVAMCRSGLENADRVVALSRELLDLADALTPVKSKGEIIHNAVSIPVAAWRAREARPGPFRLGSGGILKYAKGLPYLLKAAAGLRERHDISLELVGEVRVHERDTLERMIARTGVREILSLRPPVAREAMPAWLNSLDAFVLPSVSEGCPNILMEAMAGGLPCVASRVGAVEDMIEDGVSGLLVPYGNAEALQAALERLISMPDQGAALGRGARERMRSFSAQREEREWQTVYRRFMVER